MIINQFTDKMNRNNSHYALGNMKFTILLNYRSKGTSDKI